MLKEKNESFDQLKNKLNSIYKEALGLINKFSDFAPQNDKVIESSKNVKDKAMLNVILKLFNDYEEASLSYIHSIMQENSRIKSALMSSNSMIDIFIEKTNEIIRLSKGNSDIDFNPFITKESDSIFGITNENTEETFIKGKNSTILYNLNFIRDNIVDISEKLDLQKSYILDLKEKTYNTKEEIEGVNLIVQVPKWMPDDYITHCMNCEKAFSYGRWKHHCRVCGNIFCSNCCSKYNIFEPFYLEPVRTCDECHLQRKYNKYK